MRVGLDLQGPEGIPSLTPGQEQNAATRKRDVEWHTAFQDIMQARYVAQLEAQLSSLFYEQCCHNFCLSSFIIVYHFFLRSDHV